MVPFVFLCSVLTLFLSRPQQAHASALTTNVAAHEKACFFADVDKVGEKIGFYFAVQAGGSFDIDFTVTDPNEKVLLDGERERQGDYILTANTPGEYAFCFSNDMSTFVEKLVDFDIMVESEPRPDPPLKSNALSEKTSSLEESIHNLNGLLNSIDRTQKHFHTRENRNASTVKSTLSRIYYYSLLEVVAMLGMAYMQVFIVRKFFNNTGRRYKV